MKNFDQKLKEALEPKVIGYILYYNVNKPNQDLNDPDVILNNAITYGEDVAVLFIPPNSEAILQIYIDDARDVYTYGNNIYQAPLWDQIEWRGSIDRAGARFKFDGKGYGNNYVNKIATLDDINNAMNTIKSIKLKAPTPPVPTNKLSDVDEWNTSRLPNDVRDVLRC